MEKSQELTEREAQLEARERKLRSLRVQEDTKFRSSMDDYLTNNNNNISINNESTYKNPDDEDQKLIQEYLSPEQFARLTNSGSTSPSPSKYARSYSPVSFLRTAPTL